jgi:hypothetical protein
MAANYSTTLQRRLDRIREKADIAATKAQMYALRASEFAKSPLKSVLRRAESSRVQAERWDAKAKDLALDVADLEAHLAWIAEQDEGEYQTRMAEQKAQERHDMIATLKEQSIQRTIRHQIAKSDAAADKIGLPRQPHSQTSMECLAGFLRQQDANHERMVKEGKLYDPGYHLIPDEAPANKYEATCERILMGVCINADYNFDVEIIEDFLDWKEDRAEELKGVSLYQKAERFVESLSNPL